MVWSYPPPDSDPPFTLRFLRGALRLGLRSEAPPLWMVRVLRHRRYAPTLVWMHGPQAVSEVRRRLPRARAAVVTPQEIYDHARREEEAAGVEALAMVDRGDGLEVAKEWFEERMAAIRAELLQYVERHRPS